MKTLERLVLCGGVLTLALTSCQTPKSTTAPKMSLPAQTVRFAPTEISADVSHLSKGDQAALRKILEAARLMDEIYFRQVWSGNPDLLVKLQADTSAAGRERLHYFRINMGPWSLLDGNASFVDGAPKEKPPGANYYPEGMTKLEFEAWVKTLPAKEREPASGFFTTIRRSADGRLAMVPYSTEYRQWLEPAAKLLTEAAALTDNATLKKFLMLRAQAFLSDDYYASDVAWMELDAPIELTVGPYETYMDELLGYKAAFEVFVTLRDPKASADLAKFGATLQEIEDHLPFDPKYRNPKLAALSPIRVVDVVYAAGEGNRGVQTAAFNLPNDERVVHEKGSKRVMLKNVQEAKFARVLTPIAKAVLDPAQLATISFDAFFTHILCHELMHGLGPQAITANGVPSSVRRELKELYSAIEEEKADITGLFALQYLIDTGHLDKALEGQMYTTYLASMFRSVRFGLTEAHGKGVAVQFNYLSDEGAIRFDERTGFFSIDAFRIKEAVRKLTGEILTIEAEGSYEKAKKMLDTYGLVRPVMQKGLDKLGDIPVDIEPLYPMAPVVPGAIR